LSLDFADAKRLEVKGGKLTGRVVGEIVDSTFKAKIIHMVASREGVLLDQTVAIGDGANDILMLGQAGLGIAYNAKGRLDRVANMSLGRARLKNLLYLLGVTEEEMEGWSACEASSERSK